jgi:hypothetical protein
MDAAGRNICVNLWIKKKRSDNFIENKTHMNTIQTYSHQYAEELIRKSHPDLLTEIMEIIRSIDAAATKTKPGKPGTGKMLYDPKMVSKAIEKEFFSHAWKSCRHGHYVTLNRNLMEETLSMLPAEQKEFLLSKGEKDPLYRFCEVDFMKEKLSVEVQFGKHPSVVTDLFIKHTLFYTAGLTEAAVEILPTRNMAGEMSPGTAFFEAEVFNLMRQGKDCPVVPLLILGVEP